MRTQFPPRPPSLRSLTGRFRFPVRSGSAAGLLLAVLAVIAGPPCVHAQTTPGFRVLLYDKSPVGAAYVHTSANAVLKDSLVSWAKTYGFTLDIGADATVMTAANLAKYQTVIFDNVSSETADAFPMASQKTALLDYMQTGGFVGIHAAAEAGRWPELVNLLGAKMTIHTSETNELTATLNVDAGVAAHPMITGMAGAGGKLELPSQVKLVDEWYSYTVSPRKIAGVKVLYALDEKTFTPAAVMGDHPIAWIRDFSGGGRMFYTGMGHTGPYLAQPFMKSLLLNSIFWTAKQDGNTGIGGDAYRRSSREGRFSVLVGSGSRLSVAVGLKGAYRVELHSLDGKYLGGRKGAGPGEMVFADVAATGIVEVTVSSMGWTGFRLAMVR